jgi:hypothetical protein
MKARMLAVTLGLAAFASAGFALKGLAPTGPALAEPSYARPAHTGPAHAGNSEGTPEEQRDCQADALTYCGEHIFAPDRNTRIGNCLMQHRAQISRECRAHLPAARR